MNWTEKYEEFLHYSKEDLLKFGCETGSKLISLMDKKYGDQDKSFAVFMKIYGTFVAIDLDVKQEEYEMFERISGVSASYNEFKDAVKQAYNFDVVTEVDNLVDADDEMKELVIRLGLIICAYDGEISAEEKALIERYWN